MSSGQNQGEPAMLLLMVLVVFGCAGLAVVASEQRLLARPFFRWLRFGEVWIINLFTNHRYDACLDWLRYAQLQDTTGVSPTITALTNACFGPGYLVGVPADQLNAYYHDVDAAIDRAWRDDDAITTVGRRRSFWRHRLALCAVFFAAQQISDQAYAGKLYRGAGQNVADDFADRQIQPVEIGAHSGQQVPDKLPLFAEALSPEEWLSWNRIPVANGIPDRDATRRAFIQQLGPRWNGIDALPPYMQALFAAFALKGAQKREESDDLLGQAGAWPGRRKKDFASTPRLAAESTNSARSRNRRQGAADR